MRVLVTGGAGFIGSHLVDRLVAAGHDVLAFDDLSSGRRENLNQGARLVVGDIRDEGVLEAAFSSFAPEAVSHQAAQVSVSVSTREPVNDAQINILGTLNVLRFAAKYEVQRMVFASTGGAIYGNVPEGAADVDATPPMPMSPYACSKFAAEAYLRWAESELGLASTILRYANVYGPRQDPHGEAGVVAIFTRRVLAGTPVRVFARCTDGDDGCVRDYVFVDDVVGANLKVLAGAVSRRVANVSTGVATTTSGLLDQVERAADKKSVRSTGPRRIGDVERSVLSPTREAMDEITPLEAGLQRTVTWFREREPR